MNYTVLSELMKSVNGMSFISIDTVTDVKLAGGKKNPFQGRVQKRTTGSNVMVFQNKHVNSYEAMVKRRLAQEGKNPADFVLGPRQWGHRIENTPFVEHNDKHYLEVIFLKPGPVEVLVDGVVTDPATIDGYPARAEESEQGGLENKVIIRSYSLDSIKAISINKQRFEDRT